IETIAGSTRRGGSSALRAMLKRLKEDGGVGITPDGPRGPAMIASIGIVNIARLARGPTLPSTHPTSRPRRLAPSDRFPRARPCGRGQYSWGEPIAIGEELDEAGLETARCLVETRMVEMVREADRRVGHPSSSHWTGAGSVRPARPVTDE